LVNKRHSKGRKNFIYKNAFVFFNDTKLEAKAVIHNIQIITIRKKMTLDNLTTSITDR